MDSKLSQFAEIVINIPVNKKFHYSIPENIKDQLEIGNLVSVPFGNRIVTGYCVGFTDKSNIENIKNIKHIIDNSPYLDSDILKITKWISEYYCCSWGESLEAALPGSVKKGIKEKTRKLVRLTKNRSELKVELDCILRKSPVQGKILKTLINMDKDIDVKELLKLSKSNHSALLRLENRKLIHIETVTCNEPGMFFNDNLLDSIPRPELTEEQTKALYITNDILKRGKFAVVLLQGVTGSGKTEVYLQTIEKAISLGFGSIVLVPEIALTPQTIKYFKTRFSKVAIMHSNLTDSDRRDQWQMIKNGSVNVVIGTRSAIFAPVKNLGVVIIDEEHESSFKQENTPRYNARDVGIMRGMYNNALVVLGSATPSLESYYNATTEKYIHIYMHKKIKKMVEPSIEIVNMEEESRHAKGKYHYLSRRLEICMRQTLLEKGQIILFLNRRGFAPFVNCKRCGFILKCKNCDITLTYHKKSNHMVCHYCFEDQIAPTNCPECAMPNIKYQGFGTERIEEELMRRFPEQRVLRMDSDTMRERGSHEKVFSDFLSGNANILLGTQMIAKGLDFQNVTLVGVISADISLNIPDFRSSEKTFQLLAQVSGRTGRGYKGGHVIIQAFNTNHYSIQYAAKSDYAAFAKTEMEFRKQLHYPPYGRIIRILFLGKAEEKVKDIATLLSNKLKSYIKTTKKNVDLLGPTPASINKIKNNFRWHIILKAPKHIEIHDTINHINHDIMNSRSVQIIIDVDPGNML